MQSTVVLMIFVYELLVAIPAGTATHQIIWLLGPETHLSSIDGLWFLGCGSLGLHLMWLIFSCALGSRIFLEEHAWEQRAASEKVSNGWMLYSFIQGRFMHFFVAVSVDIAAVMFGVRGVHHVDVSDARIVWYTLSVASVLKFWMCGKEAQAVLKHYMKHKARDPAPPHPRSE